jgi:Spy/CpxP family protein refolding chaperone
MKRKTASIVTMGLAPLLGSTVVQANQHEGGGGFGRGGLRALGQLGLTVEQKSKLAELRKSQKANFGALREKSKVARREFQAKLQSDASDEDLRTAHASLQSVMKELGEARFERVLAIRKILTPEQRTKFKAMQKERMEKWASKAAERKREKVGFEIENDQDDEE